MKMTMKRQSGGAAERGRPSAVLRRGIRVACRGRVHRSLALVIAVAFGMTACDGKGDGPTGPEGGDTPRLVSVTVQPTTAEITVGQSLQLSATATLSNGSTQAGATFTWSSSNESVATVTASGLVTGLADGPTSIRASVSGVSGLASVTVEAPPFSGAWKQVSAGFDFTCGLDTEGKAFCWGETDLGRLGNGTGLLDPDQRAPVSVAGGHTFETLGVGRTHACGLTTTGRLYCWGSDQERQLGLATVEECSLDRPCASTPVEVQAPSDGSVVWSYLAVGGRNTCAITTGGALYCWGANHRGQLGPDGVGVEESARPLPIDTWRAVDDSESGPLAGRVTSVAPATAIGGHICVLYDRPEVGWFGNLACWGQNDEGQLSLGFEGPNLTEPTVRYRFGRGATVHPGYIHTCAVDGEAPQQTVGTTYCWGANFQDVMGNPQVFGSLDPVPVAGNHLFKSLDTNINHTCGVTTAGAGYCWGQNDRGQLGLGSPADPVGRYPSPLPVAGGHVFDHVSVGHEHSCGVTVGGRALCWGENRWGQLGTGTQGNAELPVPVIDPVG